MTTSMTFYNYTLLHYPNTHKSKPTMHTVRATSMEDLERALFSTFGSNFREQCILVSVEDPNGCVTKF